MFPGGADGAWNYFFATTISQHGEGRPGGWALPKPLPYFLTLSEETLPDYFFATTIVLIVAVTPSTTSTTTM